MDWGTFWASVIASGVLGAGVGGAVSLLVARREAADRRREHELEREKLQDVRSEPRQEALRTLLNRAVKSLQHMNATVTMFQFFPVAQDEMKPHADDAFALIVELPIHVVARTWMGVRRSHLGLLWGRFAAHLEDSPQREEESKQFVAKYVRAVHEVQKAWEVAYGNEKIA